MIRNLKALGAALAVFAIGAVAAQAASAQDLFTSDSGNGETILTGENEGSSSFFPKAGKAPITCKHVIYTGAMLSNSVNEVTVHPEYPDAAALDCAYGATTTTVNTDGCDYIFSGETDGDTHATVSLECTEGKHITMQIGHPTLCTVTFGSQGPLKGVSYDNVMGVKKEVTATMTVSNLHFTKIAGNFCNMVPCTEAVAKTCTSGELKETVLFKGDANRATQNPSTHKWSTESTQVNISVS